jgi:HD domain-containing protein
MDRRRWAAQPWRARGLRLLVYALPIAGSLVFVRLATAVTGVPTGSLWTFLLWWLAMSLTATAVVAVVYARLRRLLPLGALLELSLVFPDEAPSRFKLALRSGTVDSLEERLRLMKEANEAASAQEAAEILLRLAGALDVHDEITRGHSERVRAYSYSLGKELGLATDDLDRLNWAALLHDIGKLEVSKEILNKPGRPTEEEWQELRQHPLYGETLVEPLCEWLGSWAEAVGYHHERWDGDGYPRGIAGEEIPFAGRIVAIADVYDVITSARSYKAAGGTAEAREEIARCAGSQFDPRLVRAFVNISLGKMRLVMGPLSWLSHAPILARLPLTPSIGASFGGLATLATAAATGLASPQEAAQAAAARPLRTPPPLVAEGGHRPPAASQPSRSAAPSPAKRAPARRAAPRAEAIAVSPEPAPAASSALDEPAPPPPSTSAPPAPPAPDAPAQPAPSAPRPSPVPPVPPAPVTPAAVPAPSPPAAPPPTPPPPPPAVNDAPSFAAGSNQSVLEDGGAQTVLGWATAISPGPADESSQSVNFSVSVDDPTLFAVQPAVAPNGKLTYKPVADAHGVATVTVTARDDGGTSGGGSDTSSPASFTITIAPVNDAPGFAAGADQGLLEDAGAQAVAGWATGISTGPASESSQSVNFSVSVDDPTLFAVQPAVAPDGKLTYTPAADANGVATVTVTAHDNGGTADGGSDSSSPDTVTITIASVNDAPTFAVGADQVAILGAQIIVPGWATGISAGPADEASQGLSFSVSNDNPGIFAVQPTIAPNGTLSFRAALLALGTATVTVRVSDNGGTANGGSDTSGPQTFTITVIL